MRFQNGVILLAAVLGTSAAALESPRQPRPRGIVSGEVSPGRISDLSVYRAGLRLIGSMPPDQQLALLRAMLGDANLSESQMEKIVLRAAQLHKQLLVAGTPSKRRNLRGASRDVTTATMRRLEDDIGRDGVEVLGRALKARVRPNLETIPVSSAESVGKEVKE